MDGRPPASPLAEGLWALLAPRSFYEDFPLPGRDWVSPLGPYNEHLVRVAAAILPERRLVQVSLVAWLAYTTPHFAYQLTAAHAFPLEDILANMILLGIAVLLPLVLLFVALQGTKESSGRVERPDR